MLVQRQVRLVVAVKPIVVRSFILVAVAIAVIGPLARFRPEQRVTAKTDASDADLAAEP